ncbi:mitochondrial carrier domain-containing protein [Scheffersomyces coipomensis]|uniref:mitochondrial carrier domain-containing protein n=1 Tax=Scheffersomyces coipomensis TaxID=1788519 RepID=UPI00315CAD9D
MTADDHQHISEHIGHATSAVVSVATSTSPNRDFSDVVQGEVLEFRKSPKPDFALTQGIADYLSPKNFVQRCSANQLITLSGASAGFLAGVVVCPLDVVKTRLQAQGDLVKSDSNYKIKYKGFVGAFKTILREEGFAGLYRGLVPITVGYLPTWTIYFTVYERAKKFYPQFLQKNFNIQQDALAHFCSALTAGLGSSIAVNPIWVVKTRLMIQTGKGQTIYDHNEKYAKENLKRTYYKGTIDAFRKMYKEEGLRVFYSGLVPSIFGLLHVGIHFPVYEELKKILHCDTALSHPHDPAEPNSILWRLIMASSASKMVASTITYPHEILRTRMQIQAIKQEAKNPGIHKKHRMLNSLIKIYQKEGLRGFYAGYAVNLVRTVPASAVTLVSFEYIKTYLLGLSGKL